ncbi:DNA polymerase eta isoform X4 [Humulus lupulus]|uniref:DNA polymerase eta isoform X4 n=1 Tax=Humulus lupulus TaxID=3486 RepID=UPI002B40D896|nr:DNA polymerase eta isoform X4 [Humulus lupulus]
MPVARPESSDSRIIAHVDMDCFYVQVEQRKLPYLRGLPTAVVQYNEWKGGALIAVSYEARTYGVKRSMRGHEAKEVCPEIQLVQVPVARGKADLNTYRTAGSEVVSILARTGRCERASIDEVYLDLTDAAEKMLAEAPPEIFEPVDDETLKSHILGLTNERGIDDKENVREWLCRKNADHRDKLLACGAIIVAEVRMQVLKETKFTCSAGIAHNKILAKLASCMNKPAQQTVVPLSSVKGLLDSLPIKKMKQLGGKLGSSLQSDLGVKTVGDLLQFPEEKLQEHYGVNTGTWLWNIARGVSGEEVQGRLLPKSHGSGKSFAGPRALKTFASVEHWLNELCEELNERLHSDLDQNKRIVRTLTLHATAYKSCDSDAQKNFPSKSCPLRYGAAKMQEDALNLFQAGLREYLGTYNTRALGSQNNGWRITGLSVSASKIVEIPSIPCCLPLDRGQDDITQEAYLSTLGTESCSGINKSEEHEVFHGEETTGQCGMSSLNRPEQKRKAMKEKLGTRSILKFFKKTDPSCSSIKEHADNLQNVELASTGVRLTERPIEVSDINNGQCTLTQSEHKEAWSYKIDEIDSSVVDELPPEIQEEVRLCLRPQKRSNIAKRGSSIADYFLPTRKT